MDDYIKQAIKMLIIYIENKIIELNNNIKQQDDGFLGTKRGYMWKQIRERKITKYTNLEKIFEEMIDE